jgi:hypothetical protein
MLCEPSAWSSTFVDKAKTMMQLALDMKTADGQILPVGDDDSGRIVPLDWISSKGRVDWLWDLADLLFGGYKATPRRDAIYEASGWWACRRAHWSVFCEFGDVGLEGRGGHAHNDSLSICIECYNQSVFTDPGSGIYTPNPMVRNRFRSQQAHSTIMFNKEEYNRLPEAVPGMDCFLLKSPTCPYIISCREGDLQLGYKLLLAETQIDWTRRINVREEIVTINDQWIARRAVPAECSFILAPEVVPEISTEGVLLKSPSSQLIFACDVDVNATIQDVEFSACYGRIGKTKKLSYFFDQADRRSICWTLRLVAD